LRTNLENQSAGAPPGFGLDATVLGASVIIQYNSAYLQQEKKITKSAVKPPTYPWGYKAHHIPA